MDETTAIRTLVVRVLARHYLHNVEDEPLQILVGAVPGGLPSTLPIPDGSDLIGSVAGAPKEHVDLSYPRRATILFDTSLSPDQVRLFYCTQLWPNGWTTPHYPPRHIGGFTEAPPTDPVAISLLFCDDEHTHALSVSARRTDGRTAVALELDSSTDLSACSPRQGQEDPAFLRLARIPALLPPDDGWYLPMWGGASTGPTIIHISAAVQTGLDLSSLTTHYTAQLENGGWIRRSGGQEGALAWSAYAFSDETGVPWEGVLYIAQRPDTPHQYIMHLRAEHAPGS